MTPDFEPYVGEVVDTVSMELDNSLAPSSTRWVSRPVGKDKISDATLALYVDGKAGQDDVVILISNPVFPDVVQEDIEKAKDVIHLVDPAVHRHIVQPLASGRHGTQSYAAFRRLEPLSQNRVLRYFQKRRVSPGIVRWLSDLAVQTKQIRTAPDEISKFFMGPLNSIAADDDMSSEIKAFCQNCLTDLSGSGRVLFTTVEHGDFWLGNIFFERSRIPALGPAHDAFFVIDWRGSRIDGYPCLDLARYCLSTFGGNPRQSARLLDDYRHALGLAPFEMGLYCMVALGRLGMNLDKFPKDRYCSLADRIFRLLRAHGYTET